MQGERRRCQLMSGALTRTGVRRGRMGESTRVTSGSFARSSFVTTSALRELINGELFKGLWRCVGLRRSFEFCAESMRGAVADTMSAGEPSFVVL